MNWIDTHCHLDMIEEDSAEVVAKSLALGVVKMVTIGTAEANNAQLLKIVAAHPEVYGTLGVHPHNASEQNNAYIDTIAQELNSNKKILAIGECGFDFFYNKSDPVVQKKTFEKQLELALELAMPIVIHSRAADDMTIQTLEPYLKKGLKALFHCFTAKDRMFEFGRRFNVWFSYNAIATFKKSDEVRNFLLQTPQDRILIETDAPFLAPEPYRGKTNIPGYVSFVGEQLAAILKIEVTDFKELTFANSHNFYDRL